MPLKRELIYIDGQDVTDKKDTLIRVISALLFSKTAARNFLTGKTEQKLKGQRLAVTMHLVFSIT